MAAGLGIDRELDHNYILNWSTNCLSFSDSLESSPELSFTLQTAVGHVSGCLVYFSHVACNLT